MISATPNASQLVAPSSLVHREEEASLQTLEPTATASANDSFICRALRDCTGQGSSVSDELTDLQKKSRFYIDQAALLSREKELLPTLFQVLQGSADDELCSNGSRPPPNKHLVDAFKQSDGTLLCSEAATSSQPVLDLVKTQEDQRIDWKDMRNNISLLECLHKGLMLGLDRGLLEELIAPLDPAIAELLLRNVGDQSRSNREMPEEDQLSSELSSSLPVEEKRLSKIVANSILPGSIADIVQRLKQHTRTAVDTALDTFTSSWANLEGLNVTPAQKRSLGVLMVEDYFAMQPLTTPSFSNLGVGLYNSRNDCWVNAGLQMIAIVPVMQRWIDVIEAGVDANVPFLDTLEKQVYARVMCRAIRSFIVETSLASPPPLSQVHTSVIRRALSVLYPDQYIYDPSIQEDSVEWLIVLNTLYERVIQEIPELGEVNQIFDSQFMLTHHKHWQPTDTLRPLAREVSAVPEGRESLEHQKRTFHVAVPKNHEFASTHLQAFKDYNASLTEAERGDWERILAAAFLQDLFVERPSQLTAYFGSEEIEGAFYERNYACDRQGIRYQNPPEDLLLNINLDGEYNQATGQISKVVSIDRSPFLFSRPTPLRVPLLERFTLPVSYVGGGQGASYEVSGTIRHLGTVARVGHYVHYRKIDGGWLQYDDGHVTRVTSADEIKALLQEASFVYYKKIEEIDPDAVVAGEFPDIERELTQVKERMMSQMPPRLFGGSAAGRAILAGASQPSLGVSLKNRAMAAIRGATSYLISQCRGLWTWIKSFIYK